MIDLYYWPTPNGHKITIFLEETGLPYSFKPVNIGRGEQFKPDFLKIAPNNRMPAIVDHAPADGGAPVSVFESGAILVYLAEKTGRFLPTAYGRAWKCCNGCSGRWEGWGRWPGRRTTSSTTRRRRSTTRSTATSERRRVCTRCSTSGSPTASTWPVTTRSPTWPAIRGSCRIQRQNQNLEEFPEPAALVRRDPRPARGRARLREGQGGQHPTGRRRRGEEVPVRADCGDRASKRKPYSHPGLA